MVLPRARPRLSAWILSQYSVSLIESPSRHTFAKVVCPFLTRLLHLKPFYCLFYSLAATAAPQLSMSLLHGYTGEFQALRIGTGALPRSQTIASCRKLVTRTIFGASTVRPASQEYVV